MLITAASVAGWLHSKLTIVFSSSLPSPWIGDAVHRQFINPRGCSRRNADRQGRRRLRLSPNTETVDWKTELACLACTQRAQPAHIQLGVQSSFTMVPGCLWCLGCLPSKGTEAWMEECSVAYQRLHCSPPPRSSSQTPAEHMMVPSCGNADIFCCPGTEQVSAETVKRTFRSAAPESAESSGR